MKTVKSLDSWSQRFAYAYAVIFAVPQLSGFHYGLLKLALRGLGILNYYDSQVTGERFFIRRLLPRLLINRSSPVFFDVGANRGSYSMLLAETFPDAQIYAFEPHPRNYQILTELDLRNIFPYEKALGESIGSMDLFDHQDRDGSTHASLFRGVISEIHHDTSIAHRVEVDTLENVLASLGIAHIDFLKVDTEGAELAVLRGGKPLLEQKRVDVIQFEFNEMNVISRSFFYDFRTLLHGYNLFRLLPKGLLPIPESPMITELFGFQNIVAISPNVMSLL